MALVPTLDLDLLRTLVLIAEEGSFTRAADRVGRTQSAVSLQVQRLEAAVGHSLVVRSKGGSVELTPMGGRLVDRAKTLLAMSDEIMVSLKGEPMHGAVRLGVPPDYSQGYLARALAAFAAVNPNVAVDLTPAPACQLLPMMKAGDLDLMLCEEGLEPRQWPAREIWRTPLRWITLQSHDAHRQRPLPLILSPGSCPWRPPWLDDCFWRSAALKALARAGVPHHVVSTSTTVAGQLVAAQAGLGVTIATKSDLRPGLRVVEADEGLPELPDNVVLLVKGRTAPQPMTDALAKTLIETFAPAQDEAMSNPAG
jgi:DNA-binding transcriptional LysR family regulator